MQTLDQELRRRRLMRARLGDYQANNATNAALVSAESPPTSGIAWNMVATGIFTGLTVYALTRVIEYYFPRSKSGAEKYLPKSSCER